MDFALEKKAAPFHMMLMMFWIKNGKQENQRDEKGKENKKAQVMDVCVRVCITVPSLTFPAQDLLSSFVLAFLKSKCTLST